MASRFYSEAGRIIMSKPGFDASPSTPDTMKLFDSNWQAGYIIIASGTVTFNGSVTVNFPPQHFVPLVEYFVTRPGGTHFFPGTIRGTNSSFTLTISDTMVLRYIVWAF